MPAAFAKLTLGVLLTGASSACSSGEAATGNDSFPHQPLFELMTDSRQLLVAVRTAPQQPPTRGVVGMQLTITDATSGVPQTGLALKVLPWMPAMGHGTSVSPAVTESAPGIYILENLVLFMPGTWQIRTEWDDPAPTHVTPTLDVR